MPSMPLVANLLYGVSFKNNLRKRVSFKTNCKGGLFCTNDAGGKLEPPVTMTG